ncbi:hypothetical protein B1987_02125 [Mycobacterium kansasii]|nr:hypothetical protein B1987_02125 [Mycobacterium kansasii]
MGSVLVRGAAAQRMPGWVARAVGSASTCCSAREIKPPPPLPDQADHRRDSDRVAPLRWRESLTPAPREQREVVERARIRREAQRCAVDIAGLLELFW